LTPSDYTETSVVYVTSAMLTGNGGMQAHIQRALNLLAGGRSGPFVASILNDYHYHDHRNHHLYLTPPGWLLTSRNEQLAFPLSDALPAPVRELLSWHFRASKYEQLTVFRGMAPEQKRAVWMQDPAQRRTFARHLISLAPEQLFIDMQGGDPTAPWQGMLHYHGTSHAKLQLTACPRASEHAQVRVGDIVIIGGDDDEEEEDENEIVYGRVVALRQEDSDSLAQVMYASNTHVDEGGSPTHDDAEAEDVPLRYLTLAFRMGDVVQHQSVPSLGGTIVGWETMPFYPGEGQLPTMELMLRVRNDALLKQLGCDDEIDKGAREELVPPTALMVTAYEDGTPAVSTNPACALTWKSDRTVFTTPLVEKAESYGLGAYIQTYRLATHPSKLRMLDLRDEGQSGSSPCALMLDLAGIVADEGERRDTAKLLYALFADCPAIDGAVLNNGAEWVWFHPEVHLEWVSQHHADYAGTHRAAFEITPEHITKLLTSATLSNKSHVNVWSLPTVSTNQYVVPEPTSLTTTLFLGAYRAYELDHATLWDALLVDKQRDAARLMDTHMSDPAGHGKFKSLFACLLQALRTQRPVEEDETHGVSAQQQQSKKRLASGEIRPQATQRPIVLLVRLPSGAVQLVPPVADAGQ
jgi:hypothetical protein